MCSHESAVRIYQVLKLLIKGSVVDISLGILKWAHEVFTLSLCISDAFHIYLTIILFADSVKIREI